MLALRLVSLQSTLLSLASLCFAYKLTTQGLLWSPQPNVERQTCALVGYGQVATLRIM
jgi:hypothetical protein